MGRFDVAHRIILYSGTSDTVEYARFHSLPHLENPYLHPPELTPQEIFLPEGSAQPGQLRFRLQDHEEATVDPVTSTFVPASGTTAPVDGSVRELFNQGASFSILRASTQGFSDDDTTTTTSLNLLAHDTDANEFKEMRRAIMGFNTSTVSGSITGATITLTGANTGAFSTTFSGSVGFTAVTPNDESDLVAADDYDVANYEDEDLTDRIALADWDVDGPNVFTLNSNGVARINRNGNTFFSARLNWDIDDQAPSNFELDGEDAVEWLAAENGSNEPTLSVTTSEAGGRAVTSILGDAEGRQALRNSRVEYDLSDDGATTFQREFTGRVYSLKLDETRTVFDFTATDLQKDMDDEIFDGTDPSENVDWAAPPVVFPLGILGQFAFGPHRVVPRVDAKIVEVTAGSEDVQSRRVRFTNPRPENGLITEEFAKLAAFTRRTSVSGNRPDFAPDLKVAFTDLAGTESKFHAAALSPFEDGDTSVYNVGVFENAETGLSVTQIDVGIVQIEGDDPLPDAGTLGTAYIYSAAPPAERSPLHIGVSGVSPFGSEEDRFMPPADPERDTSIHWATMVSGIAAGAFGGRGFAMDTDTFDTLIADTSQPRVRFRPADGPVSAQVWLSDNLWPSIGYAPATTASGGLRPVSFAPPESLDRVLELDETNVIRASWSQSTVNRIDRVDFRTVRERQSAEATIGLAVDRIEEFDGDRVITTRSAEGRRPKRFVVNARGFRPTRLGEGFQEATQKAKEISEVILDRFQDGAQILNVIARRTDGLRNARLGDTAIQRIPWVPDIHTNTRGGARVMVITSKGVITRGDLAGNYRLKLIDNGPDQFASQPTIDSIERPTDNPRHGQVIRITPGDSESRARLDIATVNSGVAEPATTAEDWKFVIAVSGDSQHTVRFASLPSNKTHWFRARGQGPGKLPSAYTSALSGYTVAINPPTNLSATVSGTAIILDWTVGNADYPVMPVLNSGNAISKPLQAGSTRFTFTELEANHPYEVGAKHIDNFGGESATASVNATTGANGTLRPPRDLTVLQGQAEGGEDQGMPTDPEFGIGVELGWKSVEREANIVIHYDTDANFTAPVAISGVGPRGRFTDRTKILLPNDDTIRFFRAFHQRNGWNVSEASSTVSARPVALKREADVNDGFAGGSARLSSNSVNAVVLHASSSDKDSDRFYHEVNLSGYLQPTTNSPFLTSDQFPYAATTGDTLTKDDPDAFLWGRFWNQTKGFGQGVQDQISLAEEGSTESRKFVSLNITESGTIGDAVSQDFQICWRTKGLTGTDKVRVLRRSYFFDSVPPAYTLIRDGNESTFQPDADPESSSVDGFVDNFFNGGTSFTTLHDAASGFSADDSASSASVTLIADSDQDQWTTIRRGVVVFDTSGLDDAGTILEASLTLTGTSTKTDDFGGSVVACEYTGASDTAITTDDYDQFGVTDWTDRITIADWSTSNDNVFTLNATGLANIDKAGTTKIGVRLSHDIDDNPPTWAASNTDNISFVTADAGSVTVPELSVTLNENANDCYVDTPGFDRISTDNGEFIIEYKVEIVDSDGNLLADDSRLISGDFLAT